MGFIAVDGVKLEYELIPHPAASAVAAAPTIVFLHEGLGSIGQWRDFPARVAAASGCCALIYARRGYGRSAPRAGPYTPRFMHQEAAAVLPRLLAALAVERPILFGHSDGGSIALLYASGAHDNPPCALIVEAPHVFVEDRSIVGIEAARLAYLDSDLRDKLARHHDDANHTFHGWNDIWLAPEFRAWNIADCLQGIRCPVLAIQGFDDVYGTMAQIDAVAAGVPGEVALLKLAQCGHAPHREQADKTLAATLDFIKRLRQK